MGLVRTRGGSCASAGARGAAESSAAGVLSPRKDCDGQRRGGRVTVREGALAGAPGPGWLCLAAADHTHLALSQMSEGRHRESGPGSTQTSSGVCWGSRGPTAGSLSTGPLPVAHAPGQSGLAAGPRAPGRPAGGWGSSVAPPACPSQAPGSARGSWGPSAALLALRLPPSSC